MSCLHLAAGAEPGRSEEAGACWGRAEAAERCREERVVGGSSIETSYHLTCKQDTSLN